MHLEGKYHEITLETIRQGRRGVNTTYLGSWQSLFLWKLVEMAVVSADFSARTYCRRDDFAVFASNSNTVNIYTMKLIL